MKILIDKMPENPKECLFSKRNCEYGYLCIFGGRCKTEECDKLKEVK